MTGCAEKRVNDTCAACVHPCKQDPEYVVVACRRFERKGKPAEGSRKKACGRDGRPEGKG